jgi:uncharacterized membrane protein YhhN
MFMLVWVKESLLKMQTPNGIAMSVGILGFASLVTGIALVSVPAALMIAGILLMAWSAMFARAIANHGGRT